MITLSSLITFLQAIQILSRLPLHWPSVLFAMLAYLNVFALPGIVELFQLQLDCVVGNDAEPKVYRNAASPLVILFDFIQLFVIMRSIDGAQSDTYICLYVGLRSY